MSGYWVVSDDNLLAMLREVAAGGDPDIVFAEHYANSDHERPLESGQQPEGTEP